MESVPPPRTLADLPLQGQGRVIGVLGNGSTADRLKELGFCPGTKVRFERRAPLGDPLVFHLRGTRLCLRRTEAARIQIELNGHAG